MLSIKLTLVFRFTGTTSGRVSAVKPERNVRSQRHFNWNLSERSVNAGVGDDGKQLEKVSLALSNGLVCVCLCVFHLSITKRYCNCLNHNHSVYI